MEEIGLSGADLEDLGPHRNRVVLGGLCLNAVPMGPSRLRSCLQKDASVEICQSSLSQNRTLSVSHEHACIR